MTIQKRERRDWTLLIFIIPIGILLILFVGQLGVRMMPFWRINANMNSNLEPEPASARPFALLEPILPQILTPFAWFDTYLTPGADISFPPFLTFEPTATPSPTAATPSPTEDTPTPTATTPAPTETATSVTVTGTPPSPTDTEETPTDPPPSETTVSPSPTTPAPTGTISTIPPSYGTPVTPIPTEIGIEDPPDDGIGAIADGTYIVINLSVVVGATPDNNYDLAFYEWGNGGSVYFDWIIIGITNTADGSQYYQIFNWGDGTPDTNSNVGDIAGTEADNQQIPISDNTEVPVLPPENQLYDPDHDPGLPETNGPAPQTGILIDVDTASSSPPPNTYNYVVIISPIGGSGESAQVDAVQIVEVPTEVPTP